MKKYQQVYLDNLRQIQALGGIGETLPEDAGSFLAQRQQCARQRQQLVAENTALLREELFPVLDNIVSASKEEIAALEEFTDAMGAGVHQLDLVLGYKIHSALLTYARKWEKRDLLIRQLYQTGMSLFYMQEIVGRAGKNLYRWKMGLMFGEAASYLKRYDEIQDAQTRGYIHRAMGNLALCYSGLNLEDGQRKMAAIRRSLQILEDPVYQEKTPSLPWDLYLYKSHQERTTAMGLFRAGISDPAVLREVMESAEYVQERQMESSRRRGTRPSLRWRVVYEAAQYHCGIGTLPDLLRWMEEAYLERDQADYTEEGTYANLFLPALYADYVAKNPGYPEKKQAVLKHMYRRVVEYIRRRPDNRMDERLIQDMISCLKTFIEYPDGVQQKDFLIELVICRDPDIYVPFRLAAELSGLLVRQAARRQPELLVGVRGCGTVEQVQARQEELCRFAYECGMLQDVGALAFYSLIRQRGRGWLEEEREMYQYHVYAGQALLDNCPSTRPYVPAALGHHRYYDGSGGFPPEYRRGEYPDQPITDLVSAAAFLVDRLRGTGWDQQEELTLPQALEQVRQASGTVLSLDACSLLLEMQETLERELPRMEAQAWREAFRLLKRSKEN